MDDYANNADGRIGLCASFCEVAPVDASAEELEELLDATCREAGFPYCERVYVGSYFCDNYFLGLTDGFFESVRQLARRFDMPCTLVLPIFGQARLGRAWKRVGDVLLRFGDVFDEVTVNDVACFADLASWLSESPGSESASNSASNAGDTTEPFGNPGAAQLLGLGPCPKLRLNIGRLFSKELRDARYPEVFDAAISLRLSAEALECIEQARRCGSVLPPIVEVDPVSAVVDVSDMAAHGAHVAIHLPLCYATTGRNCSPASIDEPDSAKFHLGCDCSFQCLRVQQDNVTDGGVRYAKHGRTHYFANPSCRIAGTDSWRIVYAAGP